VDALYDVFVNYFPHKFGGSCPSAPRIYLRECVFVCHSASVATTESIKHVRHAPGATAAADVKLWITMRCRIADVAIRRPRNVYAKLMRRGVLVQHIRCWWRWRRWYRLVMMFIGIQWRSVHFHAGDSIVIIIFISNSSPAGTGQGCADQENFGPPSFATALRFADQSAWFYDGIVCRSEIHEMTQDL